MKEGTGSRVRDRGHPLVGEADPVRRPADGAEQSVVEEVSAEFTADELKEFLEADLYPVQADPKFKEELREKLWDLVQRQAAAKLDETK